MLIAFVKLYVYYWDVTDSYQRHEMIVSFISYAKNETYTKPDGYSKVGCKAILADIESVVATSETKKKMSL